MLKKNRAYFIGVVLLTPFLFILTSCGDSSSSSSKGSSCGTVTDIGPSSLVNGELESSDCRVSDLDPDSADTSYVDEYRLTLTSPATMTITMRSDTMDAFLFILGRSSSCASGCGVAEANLLAEDDDNGVGTTGLDAQIIISLAAGSYIIGANSFGEATGSYTLETSF